MKGERGEGRYRSVRLPSEQNPLVDREFLDEMRAEMSEAAFRAEFEAEFIDRAGAVFPEAEITEALCNDDYGNAPLWGVRYVAGVDFGRRSDWTVCAILAIEGTGVRLVALQRLQGLAYSVQVEKLADMLAAWGVCRVAPDRTGVGDAPCEQLSLALAARRVRCDVDEFVFTGPSKTALFDHLTLRMGRGQIRFPPHPALLSELRNFESTTTTTPGGYEKLAAAKGHDDCVCALALAVHAAAPFAVGVRPEGLVLATGKKEITWHDGFGAAAQVRRRKNKMETASRFSVGMRRWLTSAYRFSPAARRAGAWAAAVRRGD